MFKLKALTILEAPPLNLYGSVQISLLMLPPLQADGDGEHDDGDAGVDIENTGVDELMAIMMMRWKMVMSMILVSGHDDAENYDIVLKLREIK